MKEAYYFSHDSNARNDPKIGAMRAVYGSEGYGWYWILIEMMREADQYRLPLQGKYIWEAYKKQLECKCIEDAQQFVMDCITEFGLFASDETWFWSESLLRRMEKKEKTSERRSAAANARWNKSRENQASHAPDMPQDSKPDANALQMESTPDALKESKGKERKEKIKKISSRQAYAEDSLFYKMAVYFHQRIMNYAEGINVGHLVRNANMQVWADDFRKLVDIDKRDKDEVRQVMEWISGDVFWRRNILSPDKLRRQYERVCIQMADSKNKGGQGYAQGSVSRSRSHAPRNPREGKALSISDQELNQFFAVSSQ